MQVGGDLIQGDLNVQGDLVKGDKVAGNKNIFLNISLNSVLLALVIIILLAVGGYILWPRSMPKGAFNIAVAPLIEVDAATGKARSTELSDQISAALFDDLQGLNLAGTNDLVWGPEQVGSLSASNSATYLSKARQRAGRINATILIYGVVTSTVQGSQVALYFDVNDSVFDYGSEIAGQTRLGHPVSYNGNIDLAANIALFERIKTLRQIIQGLHFLYGGEYKIAAQLFQDTAVGLANGAETGQDVIYLLEGDAWLRNYGLEDEDEFELLQNAHRAFTLASSSNPAYPRAHLGIGTTLVLQAKFLQPTGNLAAIEDILNRADGLFVQSTSSALEKLPEAFVPVKAGFGRGQVALLRYETGFVGNPDEAIKFFTQAISDYTQAGSPQDLVWWVASSYALRGRAQGHIRRWQSSLEDLTTAINYLSRLDDPRAARWIAEYYAWTAIIQTEQGDLQSARKSYQSALAAGEGHVSQKDLQDWQTSLDELGGG